MSGQEKRQLEILKLIANAILAEWAQLYKMEHYVEPVQAIRAMGQEIRKLRQQQSQCGSIEAPRSA